MNYKNIWIKQRDFWNDERFSKHKCAIVRRMEFCVFRSVDEYEQYCKLKQVTERHRRQRVILEYLNLQLLEKWKHTSRHKTDRKRYCLEGMCIGKILNRKYLKRFLCSADMPTLNMINIRLHFVIRFMYFWALYHNLSHI